jgi:hypothetical protein
MGQYIECIDDLEEPSAPIIVAIDLGAWTEISVYIHIYRVRQKNVYTL